MNRAPFDWGEFDLCLNGREKIIVRVGGGGRECRGKSTVKGFFTITANRDVTAGDLVLETNLLGNDYNPVEASQFTPERALIHSMSGDYQGPAHKELVIELWC